MLIVSAALPSGTPNEETGLEEQASLAACRLLEI